PASTPEGAPAPAMGERSGAPSGFSPSSIVISKPPVAVQLPQPDVSANRDAPQRNGSCGAGAGARGVGRSPFRFPQSMESAVIHGIRPECFGGRRAFRADDPPLRQPNLRTGR